jgi:hypothetical protein
MIKDNLYKKYLVLLILITSLIPTLSFAHPGRTDSAGCHTCRTNCAQWGLSTGEYHCHQSKGVTQPIAPVKSIKAEQKTVPAPEYSIPKNNVEAEAKTVKVTPVNKVVEPVKSVTKEPIKSETVNKSWIRRLFSWLF